MNTILNQSDNSSDDSDQDYVPPTKRRRSSNSDNGEDSGSSLKENIDQPIEKAKIETLWKEFNEDCSSTACSRENISVKHSKANSDSKLKPGKGELEITEPGESKLREKKISSVPGKSNLDKLLKERTDKKRKKPASILNTSKQDWEGLKARDQLSEELTRHNKDGFLQRQDFLMRCEEREHDNLLESRSRKKK